MAKTNKELVKEYLEKGLVVCGLYDCTFKALMTDENCKSYVADILSNITKVPKDEIINNLVFKNSELKVKRVNDKKKVTDIIVEVKNNIINLEMSKDYYDGVVEKNVSYRAQILEESVNAGDNYGDKK